MLRTESNGDEEIKAVDENFAAAQTEADKRQNELLHSRLISAKFGNIVTVLMQSEPHKDMRLNHLRDYVVPPLMTSQYRLAEASKKGSGNVVPVGLILWAKVADEIDQKLRNSLDKPFILLGDQWSSGENYWIIDAVGEERFLTPLLTDLRKTDFKGKPVNYRVRTPSGPAVKLLEE